MEEGVNLEELIDRKLTNDKDLAREDALEEVIADSCEMMLEDTRLPDIMARENPNLLEQIRDWLKSFAKKIASAFKGVTPYHEEARAMVQYANELQIIWDNAMAEAVRNTESGNAGEPNGNKNSFRGYDEKTGRGIYESNFPKGTPRKAKGERILNYIQNVWSKKPITLVINNSDGTTRKIKAQFDSTYSAEEGKFTDASKLMGGNKHGTSSEQRVTLDLADDYYDIAAESTYNYSKNETGKKKSTHDGVKQWHYFINDILFQEYGKKETTPYRVTINVKERSDGQFVYSFNAEKQKESSSTRRTLHADDTHNVSDMSNAQTSNINIPQSTTESNSKYSKRERDNEYIEAVNAGDTKTAQRLVNEAAEEAMPDSKVRSNVGLAVVYHATYNDFTVFDRRKLGENTKGNASSDSAEESAYLGFWFNTKDLTKTNAYAGGKGVKTFLNISNPYKTTLPMLLNELENQWDDSLTHRQNAENYVDDLRDAGYDGIELTDTEFGGGIICSICSRTNQIRRAYHL